MVVIDSTIYVKGTFQTRMYVTARDKNNIAKNCSLWAGHWGIFDMANDS